MKHILTEKQYHYIGLNNLLDYTHQTILFVNKQIIITLYDSEFYLIRKNIKHSSYVNIWKQSDKVLLNGRLLNSFLGFSFSCDSISLFIPKNKIKNELFKDQFVFFNTLNSFIKNKYITFDDDLRDLLELNSNLL